MIIAKPVTVIKKAQGHRQAWSGEDEMSKGAREMRVFR